MEKENIYKVNRLIYLSFAYSSGSKRMVSLNQTEMQELLQRFQADENFQELVEQGLAAMELQILALEDGGLRLSARGAGCFFASNMTDYGKILARNIGKPAELLSVHCAVATAFFPTEAELDIPVEDLGAIVIEDVFDILRRFSRAEARLPEDDDLLHPQVRTAAQRLRELPEENPDSKRTTGGNSWMELINLVIRHLVESGYMLEFEELPGEIDYRPTPAYQAAMKKAAVYAFHSFRDLAMAKAIPDPVSDQSSEQGEERHVSH